MLELKANYYCSECGHTKTGINIDKCPRCGAGDLVPKVTKKELRILPQMFEMAQLAKNCSQHDTARELLAKTSFGQANAILTETKELLLALFKKGYYKTKMNPEEKDKIIMYGKQIGKISEAIINIEQYL